MGDMSETIQPGPDFRGRTSQGHRYVQRPPKHPAVLIRYPTEFLQQSYEKNSITPKIVAENIEAQEVMLTSPMSHHQEGDDLTFLGLTSNLYHLPHSAAYPSWVTLEVQLGSSPNSHLFLLH